MRRQFHSSKLTLFMQLAVRNVSLSLEATDNSFGLGGPGLGL